MPQSTAYTPGVCNINTVEIAERRKVGYTGLVIFMVLLTFLLATSIDRWYRLVLILPAVLAASGFLQARHKFCVGYGAAGLQNAAEDSNSAAQVTAEAAVAKDKQRAKQINRQSLAVGIAAGLLSILLPTFR